jgi:predicted anti-sigma-YlaC factor YlaD
VAVREREKKWSWRKGEKRNMKSRERERRRKRNMSMRVCYVIARLLIGILFNGQVSGNRVTHGSQPTISTHM